MDRIQLLGQGIGHVWEEMRVAVQRYLDGRMTEHLAHEERVRPRRDRERGARMPQVVPPNPGLRRRKDSGHVLAVLLRVASDGPSPVPADEQRVPLRAANLPLKHEHVFGRVGHPG
jgi:hypothetical protein